MQLSGSVGRSGKNAPTDVTAIQQLMKQRGLYSGAANGVYDNTLGQAIERYQKTFLVVPDGRIDPNGATLRRLLSPPTPVTAPTAPAHGLTSPVHRPAASTMNPGLRAATNSYMMKVLGPPRNSYSKDCQPITNPTLSAAIKTASVGPFKVRGYSRAVDSLAAVMEDIKRECPEVYPYLGTAGMLCCRFVRGSTSSISNHSWGTAIDLTLNKRLDTRGDNLVQYGLTLIAPIFNRHLWYWGAAFRTEDAMHFEVSCNLFEKWRG